MDKDGFLNAGHNFIILNHHHDPGRIFAEFGRQLREEKIKHNINSASVLLLHRYSHNLAVLHTIHLGL
ncbi:uncharacterized protein MELLADRAFT_70714 [Melampsora larici-populina 98AG31]|uniref:Uncharacterized protein n=1 Tax=Melampsora larici-populina (strain 98AG31 / pathotype 3-4-7) TaxID=747676 RepID=F4R5V5_MELLP|nr:uncharacterized protein MELLADRAFT_70714 [Melampsora larici-populina 98AG31]EGG12187.1 hypothetical protein MELLADRAFT_70714 [Melampsora larici-populina 98AG31]